MAIAITEQQRDDLIPLLSGEVEKAFEFTADLANMFEVVTLENTDTYVDRVVGQTHVQGVDWTEDDKASQIGAIGKIEYEVKNTIYVKHAETNIAVLLSDVNVLKELGEEDGKALARQRDVTILTALIRGSLQAAMAASGVSGIDGRNDLDEAVGAGVHEVLDADGDETDADKVVAKLKGIITAQRARRKFHEQYGVLIVSHGIFDTLLDNDKLADADFSGDNANLAMGTFKALHGVRVMPVTTFQDLNKDVADTVDNPVDSTLTATALDAQARAVLFEPRSIRVLEVMPIMVDAWYNKDHKVNYIDSQTMYNVGVRRQDKIAALFHYNATQEATVGAGNTISSNLDSEITVV